MKETTDLLSRLNNTSKESDLKKYLEDIDGKESPLRSYLNDILIQKQITLSDVANNYGFDRTYCYQIFNGTRNNPGFDRVIAIALKLDMNLEETNKFLQLSGNKTLYSKSKRDSIIIYAINQKMNVMDLNFEFNKFGEEELQ